MSAKEYKRVSYLICLQVTSLPFFYSSQSITIYHPCVIDAELRRCAYSSTTRRGPFRNFNKHCYKARNHIRTRESPAGQQHCVTFQRTTKEPRRGKLLGVMQRYICANIPGIRIGPSQPPLIPFFIGRVMHKHRSDRKLCGPGECGRKSRWITRVPQPAAVDRVLWYFGAASEAMHFEWKEISYSYGRHSDR